MTQSFSNREVDGFFVTYIDLTNTAEGSSAPVYGLSLEFISDQQGLDPREEYLVSSGPHGFMWFFGDVSDDPGLRINSPEAAVYLDESHTMPFTPGFDASMTVDRTVFSEPGTQVVTITIIPRHETLPSDFIFHLNGGMFGNAADAVILNLDPGEFRGPAGEWIMVSPDRKDIAVMELPLVLNEVYTFSMTLQVDPEGGSGVTYRPYLAIASLPGCSAGSSAAGNSISIPVEGVGTWIWSATGNYSWFLNVGGLQYEVSFN